MTAAHHYWIATVRPDRRPHAVPVWGVWVDETLFFGGGPDTRWARNLAATPQIAVHLEDGAQVVILEGVVDQVTDPDHPLVKRIMDAYETKYDNRHPPPFWRLGPRVAFAWTRFPDDATRWRFDTGSVRSGSLERGCYSRLGSKCAGGDDASRLNFFVFVWDIRLPCRYQRTPHPAR
jgi:hypothetical protein